MKEVRTRFAPSPTGKQHIGGFRSALYNWLFARHYGGKFLLRIEDTDQERKVPGSIRDLFNAFEWFGLDVDEGPSLEELAAVEDDIHGVKGIGGPYGPYVQSLRKKLYLEAADNLVASGAAYRCDCTPEMIERERLEQMARKETPGYSGYCRNRDVSKDTKHVVRFKMPIKRSLILMDAVKGRVSWDSIPLKDPVLLKSDGLALYHLAVVVDDHYMQISHVLRGDEWLATAPLHLLLYEALGWEPPVFAHLPPVMGNDGKKLAKRHGDTAWEIFREKGYLPEALRNFLALIGWSPGEGDNQEIFTREELISKFSLEHVNNAGGVFDYGKLTWMNGAYIRNLSDEEFTKLVVPLINKAGLRFNEERWRIIVPFVKERTKLLTDVVPMVEFLFTEIPARDFSQVLKKDINAGNALRILEESEMRLKALDGFQIPAIEGALRPLADELGVKLGNMLGVVRLAVTGKLVTPPLFESIAALGRDDTVKRVREAREQLASAPSSAQVGN